MRVFAHKDSLLLSSLVYNSAGCSDILQYTVSCFWLAIHLTFVCSSQKHSLKGLAPLSGGNSSCSCNFTCTIPRFGKQEHSSVEKGYS